MSDENRAEDTSFTTKCCDVQACEHTDGPSYWQMAEWAAMIHHFSVQTDWALIRLDEMVRWWKPLISMVTELINSVYEGSVCILCPDAVGWWCWWCWWGGSAGIWSGSLVLHLLEELVGGVLVAVLLHLSKMALLRGHRCVNLRC